MASGVYLTAIEPGSGKSVVALGMMESLARLGRVAYFRPVVPSDTVPDNDLSRGALVADIVHTVAITAIQAQGSGRR